MAISETVSLKTERTSTSAQTVRKGSGFIFKPSTIFFLKIIVAAGTLFWLVKNIQFEALLLSLSQADLSMVIFAFVLVAPNLLIQTMKWRWLLNLSGSGISLRQAFKSFIAGVPLGFITPGRLGEFGRALFVREIHKTQVLKLVAVDKIANMFIVVFLGLVGLATFHEFHFNINLLTGLWLSAVIVFLLFCTAFLNASIQRLRRWVDIAVFLRKDAAKLFFYSFAFFCTFTIQFYILVHAFSQVEVLQLLQAILSVFITKTVLPIALGDLGIREGASVFFLGKIGIAKAAAFNASLLLFIFNVGFPALIGLFQIFKYKGKKNSTNYN